MSTDETILRLTQRVDVLEAANLSMAMALSRATESVAKAIELLAAPEPMAALDLRHVGSGINGT